MASRHPWYRMAALVAAGELIFGLPFHLPRFFRPTYLAELLLTNTELGDAQALYGIVAMLAYLPGGYLADRFSARALLVASLLATAAGGIPLLLGQVGPGGLPWLYAYWGATTILLFWGALIRATREWGGEDAQGRAYGWLDAGRGLAAALLASVAGGWLASQSGGALPTIVAIYVGATSVTAAFVWWSLPAGSPQEPTDDMSKVKAEETPAGWAVLSMPQIWLQSLIVVCAYVGYKSFDNISLYAHEVLGMTEARAALWSAGLAWLRVPAALGAGWWADRVSASTASKACFASMAVGAAGLGATAVGAPVAVAFVATAGLMAAAMFGLRGVYFALFQEARVPLATTGLAVGLVSVVGYTPDVFMGAVGGRILDGYPGAQGHGIYFAMVGAVALVGLGAAWIFARLGAQPGEASG